MQCRICSSFNPPEANFCMKCGTSLQLPPAASGLDEHLAQLQRREFIHPGGVTATITDNDVAYAFKHALIQEATYESMLLSHRRQLHGQVAEALLGLFPGREEELAGLLGYHYEHAGDTSKAVHYLQVAGDHAHNLYANEEAVAYYSRALTLLNDEQTAAISRPKLVCELQRACAAVYEILGQFEAARDSLEAALALATTLQNRQEEWQALLALGTLWASRDYDRTGDYFRRALELAQAMNDPAILGHSLNRLGNWYLNIERPLEAMQNHQEALAIFRRLNDQRGLAQTLDLLGMTGLVSGDVIQGAAYYREAIPLFTALDDSQGLASALSGLAESGPLPNISLSTPATNNFQEPLRNAEQAMELARQIGWRAGEAFALMIAAMILNSQGEFNQALAAAEACLKVAENIGHRQWMTGARTTLAHTFQGMLVLKEARQQAEMALELARETSSQIWLHMATTTLVFICIDQGEIAYAHQLVTGALPKHTPMHTGGQRLLWYARARVALAEDEPGLTLDIAERLWASLPNAAGREDVPPLALLQGQALAALQQPQEAETILQAAVNGATTYGLKPFLWQAQASLGQFYRQQQRGNAAAAAFATARGLIRTLGVPISDPARRQNFQKQATARLLAAGAHPEDNHGAF